MRQIRLDAQQLQCEVHGLNAVRDGLPVLTEVRVHYRMRIPAGTRESVDRALAKHLEKCPTAASLKGAVAVSWTAEIEEAARVDGASTWVAFRRVLLPMAGPILAVVFLLSFIGAVIEYPVASVLLTQQDQ